MLTDELKETIREQRLIPFIGAGFNKNIHPNIPDWSQVMGVAANLLDFDEGILKSQADNYQIAEYLDRENKLGKFKTELIKIIDDQNKFKITESTPHLLLPLIKTKSVYTTNWDQWIERGFKEKNISYNKIANRKHFRDPERFHGTSPFNKNQITEIIKFHGDFDNEIVVKESDYFDRMNFEDPIDIRLRDDLVSNSVIFIGYSFTDMNVRYIWYKLNKIVESFKEKKKSYFVTHQVNPVTKKLFKDKNIDIISLNPLKIKWDIIRLFESIISEQK